MKLTSKITMLFLTLYVNTLSSATLQTIPEKVSALEHNFALANGVIKTEVTWIPYNDGKFLALKREYLAATKLGVAIMLPDIGNLPTNEQGIEQLRIGLNDVGWDTLSLMPPNLNLSDASYHQQLLTRLKSAIKFCQDADNEFKIIIIAQGRQVSYLTRFMLDQLIEQPEAVILLDALPLLSVIKIEKDKTAFPATYLDLSEQISQLPLSVLDIYRLQDNLNVKMALRKKLSIKNKQAAYRQTELFSADHSQRLITTVYGWLKTTNSEMN